MHSCHLLPYRDDLAVSAKERVKNRKRPAVPITAGAEPPRRKSSATPVGFPRTYRSDP